MPPRRRINRIAGLRKAGLANTGGRVRSAEEVIAATGMARPGELTAVPLPRDTFPYSFGPGTPLYPAPLDPTRRDSGRPEPRLWEYPVSWNLPSATDSARLVPWKILRDAALLPLIRDCIRVRKNEVLDLEWDITLSKRAVAAAQRAQPGVSRLDVETQLLDQLAGEIERAVHFWQTPDPGNGYTFVEWLSQALEEHLVLDAIAIYPRRTLGGDLYSLEVLDASTVKPLLDHRGGRPQPPQPAYQQILHGFPRGEFTADVSDMGGDADPEQPGAQLVVPGGYAADQLIYIRREVRSHTPYGLSAVEQSLSDIDLWMKRVGWMRSEYTDGVMPSGWLLNEQTGSNVWSPQQIAEYERALNDYLSGNTQARMRYRVLPPGLKPHETSVGEAERYKPDYDLHLMKLVVAHFDLNITELGFTEAKGLGGDSLHEGQADALDRKATRPTLKWLASILTGISRAHLGLPAELEFRWLGMDEDEGGEEEQQLVALQQSGSLTWNELRDQLGRPRYTFPEADKPALVSGGTITFLEGAEQRAEEDRLAAKEAFGDGPDQGDDEPDDGGLDVTKAGDADPKAGGPPGPGSATRRSRRSGRHA